MRRLQEIAAGTGIGAELATAIIGLEDGLGIVMRHTGAEIPQTGGLADCEEHVASLEEQRELLRAVNDELRAGMSDLRARTAAIQEAYDESRRVGQANHDAASAALAAKVEAENRIIELEGANESLGKSVGMWRDRAEWARQADLDAPWPPPRPEDIDTAAKRRMLALHFVTSAGATVAMFWIEEGSLLGLSGRLEGAGGASTEFDRIRVGS